MANDWPAQSLSWATRQIQSARGGPGSPPATASLLAGGTGALPTRPRCGVPQRSGRSPRVLLHWLRTFAPAPGGETYFSILRCPPFHANHCRPSPLPIGQERVSQAVRITVNVESLASPPPPPINVHARGSVRPRYAGWRCQIASTFSNPPPHASRGATPARRGRANTPSILCGWARGAPPMDRRPRPCPPFETRHWAGGALAALSPRSRDTRSQRGPRRGGPPPQSVVLPPTRQHRAPLRPFCGGGHRAGAGAHDASPGVHTLLDTRSYAGYRARRPPPAPPPRQGFRASAPPLRG